MIHLQDYLYEAELNLEWWNSKSPAYQKRYLTKHPNSIYAQKVKSGELEGGEIEKKEVPTNTVVITDKPAVADKYLKKKQKLEDQIKSDTDALNKKYLEHKQIMDEYKALPQPESTGYDFTTHRYMWKTKEDEDIHNKREKLRGYLASVGSEIWTYKHRIELAERAIKKLHRQVNFESRLASPNATKKYAGSGIAEVIDFAGMDKDTEEVAVKSVEENIKKYPFMKGHLTFLGSHKSEKFRQLSDQLAHDFYLDSIEKEYNKAKDYYDSKMKGYHGTEKDPARAYEDKDNWDSEESRDNLKYYLYNANEAYAKMSRIDSKGGPEGYLKTPTYQNAINKWKRVRSRTWAFYRPDQLKQGQQGLIAFNENKFDDAEIQRMVDIKWHPEGCASKKATLDHEFGHAIWYNLGLDKVGAPNQNGNDSLGRSPLQRYISSEMYMGKIHVKNHLSEYAVSNSSEFFAEAYSEYLNNPNPRPIAKKVGELLDQEIELRGYKK